MRGLGNGVVQFVEYFIMSVPSMQKNVMLLNAGMFSSMVDPMVIPREANAIWYIVRLWFG